MIHGVFLDSIGLALFSLAWWGWLIGGGLAVVGMLFGVHVAVGAPEAQAYSSSDAAIADALSRGDVSAAAQLQAQSQPGYSAPSSSSSYDDDLADRFSRGDVSAGVEWAQGQQQEYMSNQGGPVTRPLTQQEIAERDAAKAAEAAEDAEWVGSSDSIK